MTKLETLVELPKLVQVVWMKLWSWTDPVHVLFYKCSNWRAGLRFFKGEIGQNSFKQQEYYKSREKSPSYSFSSPCNTKRLGNAILDSRANVGQFNRDKTSSQSFHVRQPWPKGGSNYSTKTCHSIYKLIRLMTGEHLIKCLKLMTSIRAQQWKTLCTTATPWHIIVMHSVP